MYIQRFRVARHETRNAGWLKRSFIADVKQSNASKYSRGSVVMGCARMLWLTSRCPLHNLMGRIVFLGAFSGFKGRKGLQPLLNGLNAKKIQMPSSLE